MQIQIDMPLFTQKELAEATGIKSKTIDNFVARLAKIVPLGTRPGKGDRRLFTLADARTLKIIAWASYFIGETEAAKITMDLHPQIAGILELDPKGCLVVEKRKNSARVLLFTFGP